MEKHFNGLTPAEAERLTLLLEEAAEVIQVIGKIQRHGYESRHPNGGPTNRELLMYECGHVKHALDRLCKAGDLDAFIIQDSADKKAISVVKYLHHNT